MNVTGVVNKQLPVRIYEANEHDWFQIMLIIRLTKP